MNTQAIDTAKSLQRIQKYLERFEVGKGYYKISANGSYPVGVKFNECTDIQRYTTRGKWCEWDKEPEIFLKGV